MAKDAYYFSHDSNAREDEKIVSLRMEMGWKGYGLFWAIVEMLRDADGYKLHTDCKRIAFALQVDCNTIEKVVHDFGLFEKKGDFFWSESLMARMSKLDSIREQRKKAANKRWNNKDLDANAKQKQSDSNAVAMQSRVEKSRANESRVEKSKASTVSDESMHLTDELLEAIRRTKPDLKQPTMKTWASVMDKIVRIDKRDAGIVGDTIRRLPEMEFWSGVVFSPAALRKNFDKIEVEARRIHGGRPAKETAGQAQHRKNLEVVDRIKRERGIE